MRFATISLLFGALKENLNGFLRMVLGLVLGSLFLAIISNAYAQPPGGPYIVVLDAGHGGEDKGAVAYLGKKEILEKDLTLGLAIRTQKILNDKKYWAPLGRSIRVVMTRTSDKEVSLEERAKIAHEKKAHLFVSIHCNAESTGKVSGIETYFLNNTDSSSTNKLEEIEARENQSSVKYAQKVPNSLLIRSIAADAVVDSSREAAEFIHRSAIAKLSRAGYPASDRKVKQALLYVLLDAQVPAVLFEALFMTHKKDLAYLADGQNRQVIAEGLAAGILRFLATQ